MPKPLIKIVDHNSTEVIEREMTDAEFMAWDVGNKAKAQAELDASKEKAAAEAKLSALGLTIDDLKVLGLG